MARTNESQNEINGRWNGVVRPYTQDQVQKLRGSLKIEYTLARMGAERLWELSDDRANRPTPGAAERSCSRLDRLSLAVALARLTPRQRALVRARFVVGHSERDAALAAGYAPSSFKKTMSRILARLRRQLDVTVEETLAALGCEPAEP